MAAFAAVALGSILVVGLRGAAATWRCEDINGKTMILGEARYSTVIGTDTYYANAYWDNGAELALDYYIGGADTTAMDLQFSSYGYLEDNGGDCASVTFEQELQRSNTQSGGCPTAYSSSSDTLVINSCAYAAADTLRGGRAFGRSGLAYRPWWRSIISVSGNEGSASDQGCWAVLNQTDCTLESF